MLKKEERLTLVVNEIDDLLKGLDNPSPFELPLGYELGPRPNFIWYQSRDLIVVEPRIKSWT